MRTSIVMIQKYYIHDIRQAWCLSNDANVIFFFQIRHSSTPKLLFFVYIPTLGVKIRNMKMVFNIYGTWHWVMFEKLMMKIYVFFYSAKSFSHPI